MFHINIIEQARTNTDFRRVIATQQFCQLVLMSIEPKQDIGDEVHHLDQLLFFVEGLGMAVVAGQEQMVEAGYCVVVPAGTRHNFINTGQKPLKLFTVYAPAQHPNGTIHATKADALKAEQY